MKTGSDPLSKTVTGSDPVSKNVTQHYSYTAYADPEMAASFDAKRFGGPIGELLVEDQERVLARFLGNVSGCRVLDLGTGTGRAAMALAKRGARVTGVDASSEMLAVARKRAAGLSLTVDLIKGDAHRLDFPDRAFDSSVCLRLLMHAPDWPQCVAELCRVSDRRIVLDYPSMVSAAAVEAIWRRMALVLGQNVEAYRVFSPSAIARELARHGFQIVDTHKQFVIPIAFHKLIGSRGFTEATERALANIGLLRLGGSPVTIAAERCAS
jgi:SAM-dependent methyltransferase